MRGNRERQGGLSPLPASPRRRLGRACSVEAAAALHLGGDCADARTPEAIAGCLVGTHDADADTVLAVAGAAADDALAAERRDPGFCGDTRATVERRLGRLLARMTLAEVFQCERAVQRGGVTGIQRRLGIALFERGDDMRRIADRPAIQEQDWQRAAVQRTLSLNPPSLNAAQLRYAEPPIRSVSWAPESSADV